jgi:hypothetical protein
VDIAGRGGGEPHDSCLSAGRPANKKKGGSFVPPPSRAVPIRRERGYSRSDRRYCDTPEVGRLGSSSSVNFDDGQPPYPSVVSPAKHEPRRLYAAAGAFLLPLSHDSAAALPTAAPRPVSPWRPGETGCGLTVRLAVAVGLQHLVRDPPRDFLLPLLGEIGYWGSTEPSTGLRERSVSESLIKQGVSLLRAAAER